MQLHGFYCLPCNETIMPRSFKLSGLIVSVVETCLLVAIIDSYCFPDHGTTMLTRPWLALAIGEAIVHVTINNIMID